MEAEESRFPYTRPFRHSRSALYGVLRHSVFTLILTTYNVRDRRP